MLVPVEAYLEWTNTVATRDRLFRGFWRDWFNEGSIGTAISALTAAYQRGPGNIASILHPEHAIVRRLVA